MQATGALCVHGHHSLLTCNHGLVCHTSIETRKHLARTLARAHIISLKTSADGDAFQPPFQEVARMASPPRKPQGWQQASRLRIIVKRLKDPRDITSFIKQQKEAALNTARGPHPDAAVTGFCDIMDAVLTTAGSCMNYINFAAVITASAHVWTAAQCRHSFKGQAGLHERLAALYRRCLQSLQPMLADLSAREIANVLWSSATFGFNPDAAVLGMVQDLTVRFLHFTNADKEPPRPNAQNCANFLWSLATMGHPAATTEVVHAVNLYMCALLRSQDKRVCPNAQDIANILWALAALKHAPPHDVVSAMLDCLVVLCQTPGSRPSSQAISNCLLACAELGLDVKPTWVRTLVKHFLQLPFSRVAYQEYTNATWSLAVMDCLDLNTFEAVLHRFTTKLLAQEAGAKPSSSTLHIASISQLYQTLVWLKPAPGSEQMVAWSSLRSRLQTLAPEPVLGKLSLPGLGDMEFALAAQGVPCRAQVLCGIYQAHAILSPNDNKAADVILMVQHPHEFVTNLPNRVLGHVAFRNKMLARYGTVVTVPYKQGSSVESMAVDIKAAVEAKTGLPLDSFRR